MFPRGDVRPRGDKTAVMRSAAVFCLLCLVAASAGGCATYEYNLVQPPDLARHIGSKAEETINLEPLQYRLITVENRLVIRIFNPTDDPIELLGPRSTIVDPAGQSHAVRAQTIAPNSFIKLILPPQRPQVYYPTGPTFGVGVGTAYRVDAQPWGPYYWPYRPYWYSPAWYGPPFYGAGYYGPGYYGPGYGGYYAGPRYLAVVDENDTTYWEWNGAEGQARVVLTFLRQGKEFQQSLVFRRQKM